ncbi:hypothetical protein [Methylomonas koyamae]|uniref:hypothetical protein n=1 Tax=Methylomonas koyamae TaxID=702114 RepID=UPI000B21383A|nr:hypothetical protein [Methylomonas koyamae]
MTIALLQTGHSFCGLKIYKAAFGDLIQSAKSGPPRFLNQWKVMVSEQSFND